MSERERDWLKNSNLKEWLSGAAHGKHQDRPLREPRLSPEQELLYKKLPWQRLNQRLIEPDCQEQGHRDPAVKLLLNKNLELSQGILFINFFSSCITCTHPPAELSSTKDRQAHSTFRTRLKKAVWDV